MLSTSASYPRESAGSDDEDTTTTPEEAFNTVGIQIHADQARLLFGRAPYAPRVTVPLSRVAVSGDIGDLVGYLNTSAAAIGALNTDNATINYLQNETIDTEQILTGGVPIVCNWEANATDLPQIQLINNPLKTGLNSDGSKGGFQLGEMLIGLGEAVGTDALLYFGKGAGSWLMSLGSDALSLFNGYASLSEAGLSLGADAAGTGAALGGDLASWVAGSEGLVMAESAGEAAAMFSSAGVLSELGTGFASELGEVAEPLLSGITSSTAEFEEVLATPGLIENITGSARWIAFA